MNPQYTSLAAYYDRLNSHIDYFGYAAFLAARFREYGVPDGSLVLDKTTPRLIQFHTLKNAVNPPFLGGFLISGTVAA